MSEEQLNELERLAKAATPGPWSASFDSYFGHSIETAEDSRIKRQYREDHPGWSGFDGTTVARAVQTINGSGREHGPNPLIDDDEVRDNATFIAAANPQTVLALIAEVRKARTCSGAFKPDHVPQVVDWHGTI